MKAEIEKILNTLLEGNYLVNSSDKKQAISEINNLHNPNSKRRGMIRNIFANPVKEK